MSNDPRGILKRTLVALKAAASLLTDGEIGYNSSGGPLGTGGFFGRVAGVEKDFVTTPGMLLGKRTVDGTVTPGTPPTWVGSGFSVARNGVGDYQVTFTSPFQTTPAIRPGIIGGGSQQCQVVSKSASTFRVITYALDTPFATADATFDFVATAIDNEAQGQGVGALPGGRIRLGSAANHTSNGGWQKVPLATTVFDPNLMVDTANNRLVVKTAGQYKLDGQAAFTANATGYRLAVIRVNGIEQGHSMMPASSLDVNFLPVDAGYMDLNVNDQIELWAWQNQSASLAYVLTAGAGGGSCTWLSASKTGQAWVLDKPWFRAYRNAAVSLATNAIVVFDVDSGAEASDPNGWYDTSNGKFQPTVPGVYELNWNVQTNGGLALDKYFKANVQKNGSGAALRSGIVAFSRNTGVALNAAGTAKVFANGSTDYFQIALDHDTAGSVSVNGSGGVITYFEGKYMGPQ